MIVQNATLWGIPCKTYTKTNTPSRLLHADDMTTIFLMLVIIN